MNKRLLSIGVGLSLLAGNALAGDCPPATVADAMGIPAGKYPQQYELAEFEQFAGCKLTLQENPTISELNRRIVGNPALPPLNERLPEEPLVVAPYERIGRYGGVLDAMSNAAEAGNIGLPLRPPREPGALVRRPPDDRAERGESLAME